MVCYLIWPRSDAWLIQILNVVAMFYLVYNTIAHPYILSEQTLKEKELTSKESSEQLLDVEYMKDLCSRTISYLQESKAYLRYDLTLSVLANELKVSQRNLSRSINTYLDKTFFELINEMRVEEAKEKILKLNTSDYSIESIYSECGFRSRSTFFLVFKKISGQTPSAWLSQHSKR